MKKNMGLIDRVLRVLLAFIAAGLYLTNVISGIAAVVILVIAGVFLLTGLAGYCPLYKPLKFNTLSKRK